MSGPGAIVGGVGALSLSDRTKSIDAYSFNEKDHPSVSTNREVASTSEAVGFRAGELVLSNGESYCGSLLDNMPEGSGKYVWSGSCKYEGEWRRGMRHGFGELQWPSGAVYKGEFSGGYMNGIGTYIGPDNMKYEGRWRLNLKHGLGYQVYPNGDVFEGAWIQGTPEGPGKYTWASGNVYLGNMKGGKMSGKGTLTWTNSDSYEGSWLNGMMHGFGVYKWSDGSCYIGTWTWGLKDGKGSFYPKGSKLPAGQELHLNVLRKRGLLPDLRKQNQVSHLRHASSVDMGSIKVAENQRPRRNSSMEHSRTTSVSLERRWSMDVSIEKKGIGHDSSMGLFKTVSEGRENDSTEFAPILERVYMQGVLISELVLNNSFSPSSKRAKKQQKKLAKEIKRPGETIIKGHRSYDLMLSLQLGIRNLRELFKIDAADYMMSICGNDALRELSSPEKVVVCFSCPRMIVLLRMLPNYHHHVRTYDNTLITKFFGLHRIKPSSGQKFRFVVMGNMFCTELRIHQI
ncbi:Phosphatidylinositol 4-phosphate 5-kinase 9 [Camellia lanceoleosa]|uniref:Phosphatidylinositol 4-phosphate 5-kinase 9 n=1 Tax=Camellia lanceoleosa TaxID=1840588 RepID=A0ACC0HSQ0_9ERIC|nr:Phosphatidylinositol 4-phosphate 5-kinase 9 [Camellia lanceoleosa]